MPQLWTDVLMHGREQLLVASACSEGGGGGGGGVTELGSHDFLHHIDRVGPSAATLPSSHHLTISGKPLQATGIVRTSCQPG